jgi:ribosome recycling factor
MDKLKRMERDGNLSQDEQRAWGDDLQKLTDESIKEMDGALATKEKEIMQV